MMYYTFMHVFILYIGSVYPRGGTNYMWMTMEAWLVKVCFFIKVFPLRECFFKTLSPLKVSFFKNLSPVRVSLLVSLLILLDY